jgi:hypothetical protein
VINVRKGIKDAIKKRYAGAALTVKQSGVVPRVVQVHRAVPIRQGLISLEVPIHLTNWRICLRMLG